jgi:penicillin-binding protein 1A
MIKFLSKIFSIVLGLVAAGLLIATLLVAYIIFHATSGLPDYQQLAKYNPPVVTRLYAADGKLLGEYAKEHRLFVPISSIPKSLINAFLAAEDKNFYEHPGIDLKGITRALIQNIINIQANRALVGGSTITQQVVKNFLLSNEKSLDRKIKEAILSFRISKAYSKDRILELYLNQIYLGAGSYGVASAALNYFNRSIDELSLEEAAFIAALPKAPSNYDPRRNYKRAKSRRDWVISRMEEIGFITKEEAKAAQDTPITLRTRDKTEIANADFFAEAVRRELAEKYGYEILYSGGLTVRTTLDPKLQIIAENAFRNGLIQYDKRRGYRGPMSHLENTDDWSNKLAELLEKNNITPWKLAIVLAIEQSQVLIGVEGDKKGVIQLQDLSWTKSDLKHPSQIMEIGDVIAVELNQTQNKKNYYSLRQIPAVNGGLVVIEPHTGRILAMVGGYQYRNSEFNRVNQAKRQPGSAFKPFVYLAALENGFTPASIVVDGPVEFSQGPGLPMWRPKNYTGDFLGPTTLRRGVEKSRNAMTVRLAQLIGIKKIIEVTKRFNINSNPQRNLSVVLGAEETTLLNLTNAYAMLVNGGKRIAPSMIERIQDYNGKTIYKRDQRNCEDCIINSATDIFSLMAPELEDSRETIVDPQIAYQMVSIFEGVVQRGTAQRAKKLNKTIGGKTGTTNESRDLWFIGFSPDLVVGTYIGFDTPKSLGKRETGSSGALPIFIEFMQEALKNKSNIPFRVPEGIKFMRIETKTGTATNLPVDNVNVIYEAFKPGTGPNAPTPIIPEDPYNLDNIEGVY